MFRMRDTGKLDAHACRFAVLSGLAAGVMELGSSIFLDYGYRAAWIVQAGYCLPVAVVFFSLYFSPVFTSLLSVNSVSVWSLTPLLLWLTGRGLYLCYHPGSSMSSDYIIGWFLVGLRSCFIAALVDFCLAKFIFEMRKRPLMRRSEEKSNQDEGEVWPPPPHEAVMRNATLSRPPGL